MVGGCYGCVDEGTGLAVFCYVVGGVEACVVALYGEDEGYLWGVVVGACFLEGGFYPGEFEVEDGGELRG